MWRNIDVAFNTDWEKSWLNTTSILSRKHKSKRIDRQSTNEKNKKNFFFTNFIEILITFLIIV